MLSLLSFSKLFKKLKTARDFVLIYITFISHSILQSTNLFSESYYLLLAHRPGTFIDFSKFFRHTPPRLLPPPHY